MSCPNITSLDACAVADSYLRPNAGDALMPWICSAILLTLHLPLVIVRVLRWESGQTWSIVMAAVNISLIIFAYRSTKMDGSQIMVWLPLSLVIDAGAMLQVLILVSEEHGSRIRAWLSPHICCTKVGMVPSAGETYKLESIKSQEDQPNNPVTQLSTPNPITYPTSLTDTTNSAALGIGRRQRHPWGLAAVVVTVGTLFMSTLILQIVGLIYAVQDLHQSTTFEMSWCSPAFVLGGTAFDVLCGNYTVMPADNGTGCITLPGSQSQWLSATVVVVILQLVVEVVDAVILALVNSKTKWREIKMKRPWCTMFLGISIWATLVGIGVIQTMSFPLPAHAIALMGPDYKSACRTNLYPAGLRGTIIGWCDGLFQSFGSLYLGPEGGSY